MTWQVASEWIGDERREMGPDSSDEFSDLDLICLAPRLRVKHVRAGQVLWVPCDLTAAQESLRLESGLLLPIPTLEALQVWAEPDIPPDADRLKSTERDAWFLMAERGGRWSPKTISETIHRAPATVRGALAGLYRQGLAQRYRRGRGFEWIAVDPRGPVIIEEKGVPA